jgi:ATP-binding cassette subfamily C (CFTR/MRP) protein 1
VHVDDGSEADLREIKQQLESTIGADELQQKLTRARFRKSESLSESGSITDRKSLNGSLKRQYSTESQQSANFVHSNSIKEKEATKTNNTGEKLIEVEKSETGSVKWKVYSHYLVSIGLFLSVATIVMNAIFQAFSIGSNVWLSVWSDDNMTTPNNTIDKSRQDMYLGVYGALGIGQASFVMLSQTALIVGCLQSSKMLHTELLFSILRSPLGFFDTTPSGRLLNRFGKDIDVIDNVLPHCLRAWLFCLSGVVATLVVISYSTPIFIAVILPIGALYYFIQRFYVATSRQLKRLESVSRSPIYSHFSESVTGTFLKLHTYILRYIIQ